MLVAELGNQSSVLMFDGRVSVFRENKFMSRLRALLKAFFKTGVGIPLAQQSLPKEIGLKTEALIHRAVPSQSDVLAIWNGLNQRLGMGTGCMQDGVPCSGLTVKPTGKTTICIFMDFDIQKSKCSVAVGHGKV